MYNDQILEAADNQDYLSSSWAKSKDEWGHIITLKEHTKAVIQAAKQLSKLWTVKDSYKEPLLIAALFHDFGKTNQRFQERVKSNGRVRFDVSSEVPHHYLSMFACNHFIGDMVDEENLSAYLKALYAISHHHYIEFKQYFKGDYSELVKNQVKSMPDFYSRLDDNDVLDMFDNNIISEIDRIVVTGLLMRADYAASGGYEVEYPADFLEAAMDGLLAEFREHNKEANWNAMQQFCSEHSEDNIMVTAETGMGKTEGALLWAKNHKLFFFLPVRAAINAMYERMRDILFEGQDITKKLAILHSDSLQILINEAESKEDTTPLIRNMYNRRFVMPFTISTVDQLFDFVLREKTFRLKLATLAHSKVVIDEIQMYDPTLLAFLVFGLEKIYEAGGKIAIVTATMPPFLRDFIIERISFKKGIFTKGNPPRHSVCVKDEQLQIEDIVELVENKVAAAKSCKVLVVCNTVKQAQLAYLELRERLGEDIFLDTYHSRYTREDRAEKEREIVFWGRTYDSDGNLDKRTGIWITTSVCEASLDIDFDYLFTELQTLPSLFQRLGRCNRKGVKPLDEYNCYIYTQVEDKYLTDDTGKGFIDRTLFELSRKALLTVDGSVTEEEKLKMMDSTFTTEAVKNSQYYKTFIEKYSKILGEWEHVNELDGRTINIPESLRDIESVDVMPEAKWFAENSDYVEAYNAVLEVNKPGTSALEKAQCFDCFKNKLVSIPRYALKKGLKNEDTGVTYTPLQIEGKTVFVVKYLYTPELGLCIDKQVEEGVRKGDMSIDSMFL